MITDEGAVKRAAEEFVNASSKAYRGRAGPAVLADGAWRVVVYLESRDSAAVVDAHTVLLVDVATAAVRRAR